MKRLSILTLAMIALLGFMTITVWAGPHFNSCGASGVNSDGSLNASFKIAGLGDNVTVNVTASAHADATYGCRNRGEQCPNAANKVNVQSDVSASGAFQSGKNGSVSASLTVDPPSTTLTCPGGQKLVLVSVSYTNLSVSAPGAGTAAVPPGTFAANFYPQCP